MNENQELYAGVDVGGTGIKIGLVDGGGQTRAFDSISTDQSDGPQAAMGRIAQTLDELCSSIGVTRQAIRRAGLATPGPIDLERGMVLEPGNLPAWRQSPVRDLLAKATGLPVTFVNDANAAAYGEYWAGAGQRFDSLVLITLGTGVGGGVILDGKLLPGAHGCGGELGHIVIDSDDDAPLNSLDLRGTLEGYCGSYGVVGRAEAALADHFRESSLRDSITGGEQLTPLLIANAAQAGDELALQVVMDTARYLASGIATSAHLIDPEAIVIGGAMTFGGAGHPLGERFLAEVRQHATQRMFKSLAPLIVIEFAKLGKDAGYIGAAGVAHQAEADNS